MASDTATPSPHTLDGFDSESDLTPLTDSDFSDSDDSDFSVVRQPSKKRRIAKPKKEKKEVVKASPKKLRGYKGVLQGLWALPLDVTYEIFGHLRPLDLLHLSRTSRSLRRTLLSRASTSVWMKARANVEGLPDCPFDMTEPEYASLVFEPVCHYCHANNVQTIIWEARSRCCKKCGTLAYAHWANLGIEDLPDVLRCIIPSTHEFTTGVIHPHTEKKYSLAHAIVMAEKMKSLSEEEQPLWFWRKKKHFEMVQEHSKLCRDFMSSRHMQRNAELDEARQRRTNAIMAKLAAAGWADEMTKMSQHLLTDHKHVKVPKDLTERAWSKIQGEMTAFMAEVRSKRLVKERNIAFATRCNFFKEKYATFVASQPLHAILPGVADFATMPEFKAILENPDPEATVTAEDFNIGDDKLLQFSARWREEKDNALVGILRQSSLGSSASKELLTRATTVFNCRSCSVPISYPRILAHTCNYVRSMETPDPSNIFERLRADPWNLGGDRISFHEAAHKRAKYILKALNLDHDTTVETMNEQNPFVECFCALCYRPGTVRTFARWNRMIEHTPRYTSAHVPRPYGPVDARKTVLVKKLEALELAKLRRDHDWDDYSHRSYCCMVCKARDTRQATERHLIQKHSVTSPTFGTHYTYHVDAKIRLRAPFVNLKIAPKPKAVDGAAPTPITSTSPPSSFVSTLSIPVQGGAPAPAPITLISAAVQQGLITVQNSVIPSPSGSGNVLPSGQQDNSAPSTSTTYDSHTTNSSTVTQA